MITLWLLAGRAAPGANSGTARVLPIARVARGGLDLGEVLGGPGRLHSLGFLIEADKPADVTSSPRSPRPRTGTTRSCRSRGYPGRSGPGFRQHRHRRGLPTRRNRRPGATSRQATRPWDTDHRNMRCQSLEPDSAWLTPPAT